MPHHPPHTAAERFAGWLFDHRHAALVACLALAALAVVPATQVEIDNSIERWFTEGDPALAAFRQFQHTFGNDERVVVALHREDGILTPDGFATLREATRAVGEIEGVAEVTSLASLQTTRRDLAGVRMVPLVPTNRPTAQHAAGLRTQILADSTLPPLLISADGRTAGMLVRMERHDHIDSRRAVILDALERTLADVPAEHAMAGTGVILAALDRAALDGSMLVILVANLLVFVLLWLVFRRIGPVLVTAGVVVVAVVWLLGTYGLAGGRLNTVTMVMPTLVLVISTADCVHLLLYAAHDARDASGRDRAIRTVTFLLRPCAFTTLTTAAGFLALTTSSMPVIRELGLFSAIGLVGGLVAALVGCTWALAFEACVPAKCPTPWLGRTVDAALDNRRRVLLGAGAVTGVALVGLSLVRVDTDSLGLLFDDHPTRRDSEFVDKNLGPYLPLEFVVESETPLTPELMHAVARWQDDAVNHGPAGWAWSAANGVRRLHAEAYGEAAIPAAPQRIDALVRLARARDEAVLQDWLADDRLRVSFGIPAQSTRGTAAAIDAIEGAARLPDGAVVRPSGYLPLYVRMMEMTVQSQIASFASALAVIVLMIALVFRSLRTALLSIVPNLLPVVLALGFMGFAGIPLDVATVTVAAVVLGLVVDDTVHLLHRYVHERRQRTAKIAIREAATATGRAMVVTTLVVTGGMLALLLAPIKSVVWFGALVAVGTLAALAADVLVTPALIAVSTRAIREGDEEISEAPAATTVETASLSSQ